MNNYMNTKNIKVHFIRANVCGEADEAVNDFLEEYDGNILDIQMQKIDYNEVHVMIVYKYKEQFVNRNL